MNIARIITITVTLWLAACASARVTAPNKSDLSAERTASEQHGSAGSDASQDELRKADEELLRKAYEEIRKADEELGKAVVQGDAKAQFNLGFNYEIGIGVAQDKAEAVRWYRRAAEQGYAPAQFRLGVMAEDKAEAVRWYRRAAEQGVAEAQFNLGLMYGKGEGVMQDVRECFIWGAIAAANGASPDLRDHCEQPLGAYLAGEARAEARARLEQIQKR